MRIPAWLDCLLVAAVGGLHVLAYSPATLGLESAWWLQLLGVTVLASRVHAAAAPSLAQCSVGRAAALGWCYATAWFGAATGWLYISMHRYGGLPAWLAVLAILALSGFLALYFMAAMAAFARWRRGHLWADAALFAAVWLGAELARGLIFTGFPWAASGYAHVQGPLASLAPIIGVYGLGAASAALAAASVMRSGSSGRFFGLGCAVVVLTALAAWPAAWSDFTRPTAHLRVTLLQGNVPQDEKFVRTHIVEAMQWYGEQLVSAPGELVVAPETALPVLPVQMPQAYWSDLRAHFASGRQAALVGMPLGDADQGYSNSVAGFSAETVAQPLGIYRYNKHHLVPFGEFIPLGFRWFVAMMNIPLGDFERGALVQPTFAVRSASGSLERIGPNVCYEDLFGEELAARLVSSDAPTVFANVSNIAWFGESLAIAQHLQISRMRALELQRPMLRATNTGATAVITHTGQVSASLAPNTRDVLTAEVQGRHGLTPYAWWAGHFGLWPLVLLSGGGIWLAARRAASHR